MPWKQLSCWFANRRDIVIDPPMPLTLVTLRCPDPVDREALTFYADAEFAALVGWAVAGRFVLAFATLDRDELTLVCTDPAPALMPHIAALPLVTAGLAHAELRAVTPVRLTMPYNVNLH